MGFYFFRLKLLNISEGVKGFLDLIRYPKTFRAGVCLGLSNFLISVMFAGSSFKETFFLISGCLL